VLQKIFSRTHPLRRRLQQAPYYRFQSFEEIRLAASWGARIDVNTASIDDWLRLPGISIHQARSLTQLTSRQVSFTCIEDIAAALNLPVQQIQPWQAILQFCYYDLDTALDLEKVNVNTATAVELAAVPAIDTFLGRAIVHYRQAEPYKNMADLQDRLRLTPQIAIELLHYLEF
jgi:DNA uptake protein ComE-like DNA-binding protein